MSDSYRVETAALRRVLAPLEESMVAAKDVRDKHGQVASRARDAGSPVVSAAVSDFLSAWGYGMGELVKHAEDVVEKLTQTIDAYEKAEALGIENFTPTEKNVGTLPTGDSSWQQAGEEKPELPSENRSGFEEWADGQEQDLEDWMFG